ncbi:MAG: hypothetical protein K0S45_2369 [Nitrospira sp.]|jgi:hypothetical protein|nr:hypothetical protein [Nitrospira sp.]
MQDANIERKMVVIREYLQKSISDCKVLDGPHAQGEKTLIAIFGKTAKCTLQISSALLSDMNPTPMELGWALKEKNIAGKVTTKPRVCLTHNTLSENGKY